MKYLVNCRFLFFSLLFGFCVQCLVAQWLIVEKDGKSGVFNIRTKQFEIPIVYDEIHYDQSKGGFDYFMWLSADDGTHYAFTNRKTGKLVHITNGELSYFTKDTFLLQQENTIRFIDRNGEMVGPADLTRIEWIVSDGASLVYQGEDCYVMEDDFNILPCSCEEFRKKVEEEEEQKSLLQEVRMECPDGQSGTYGYINKETGQVVMQPVCGQSIIHANEKAFIMWYDSVNYSDRQYYLFDRHGNQVTDMAMDSYDIYYRENYVLMRKDGRMRLFDLETGDWLSLPYKIHFIQIPLSLAVISENGKYGLYDVENRCLVEPCLYDSYEIRDASYVLERDGKKGLWNWYGKHLLPAEYDEISEKAPYIFRKDSLYGMVTYDKSEFFPAQFKEIGFPEDYEDIVYAISDSSYHFYRFRYDNLSEMDVCTYKGKHYPSWQRLSILKDGNEEVLYDCETQQVLYTVKDAHIDYIYYDGRAIPVEYPNGRRDFVEVPTGRSLIPEGFVWNIGSIAGADFIHLFLQTEDGGLYGVYEPGKEEWLVPPIYTDVDPAHFGRWTVKDKENKWGIWSQFDNALILPVEYDRIDVLY